MRRVTATILTLVLPAAVLCAPRLHAHLDGHADRGAATRHHRGPVIHAHGAPHGQSGDTRRSSAHAVDTSEAGPAGDERPIRVPVFVAVSSAPIAATGVVAAAIRLQVLAECGPLTARPTPRSHGPPDSGPSGSRAPPSSPSRLS